MSAADGSQIDRALTLVARATGLDPASLSPVSGIDTLPEWDSIAHINIIMALEETSGRQVGVNEIAELVTVEAIAAYLAKSAAKPAAG
ncbi:MAG: hypothetical protein CML29_05885 [Rhizobiales bacterium]|nr:hypothetical protein [Hyphomicrobiales bacterium]MBA68375.1 hypothetical protein [Hyphomicrobiales bacterium]|tara:strand:- start:230 stop:493 length:264 start_codon:yes stop_codon:yes gene_type:complete